MALTAEQIQDLIDGSVDERVRRQKQKDYYDGKHAILDNPGTNKDGSKRVAAVHNLIAKTIDRHVGFALSDPVQIVSKETEAEQADEAPAVEGETGFDLYEEMRERNDLDCTDAEHYRTSLKMDVSYEIFSFDKGFDEENKADTKVVITKVPTIECIGIYDSNDELQALIRIIVVKQNSFWDGEFVAETREEVWVYEAHQTAVYTNEPIGGEKAPEGEAEGARLILKKVEEDAAIPNPEPNILGRLLIVPFTVTEKREPFMSAHLIGLQDNFNRLMSMHGNSVIEDSKEHWIIKGFRSTAENLAAFWEMMRQNIIFIPNDAEAKREKSGTDVGEVEFQRDWTRAAIFETAGAADTERIVGTTGTTSGIALKLAHVPQSERASSMIKFFTRGIRKRIELLNVIHKNLNRPELEKFTVQIDTRMIINETELWGQVANLREVLSLEDTLMIAVPSIENPNAAAERKREEEARELDSEIMLKDAEPGGINAPVGIQAAARRARRADVEAKTATRLGDQFNDLESALSDEDAKKVVEEAKKLGVG